MAENERPGWHPEVISESTAETLRALNGLHLSDGFYLAGGTGLALQIGHRLSLDLDFFSADEFNEDALLQRFQSADKFRLTAKAPFTIHGTVGETKVSFLGYKYPILYPAGQFLGVSVFDPRDIACMKLSALASRGAKRDFVDLYECAQIYGLREIFRLFNAKFAGIGYSHIHILKSLTWFQDAEKDPMPHMLIPLEWETVRRFFLFQTPELL
jgi:hypothetical protein